MIRKLFRNKLLAVVLLISIVNGDEIDNRNSDDDDEAKTLESDSIEVYNTTSKEKPARVDVTNSVNGNITTDVSCKDAETTTPKVIRKWNYKTDHPYTVSIQKKGSHYASGALVDKKWILTVAAEFFNIRESIKLFRARLGSINCKKGGTLVPLKWIEIHPSYEYKNPSFDLAMLRIARPLEFSEFIKPIGLSKVKGEVVNAKFLATYWPRLIINGEVLPQTASERLKSNSLRVSTQSLKPQDICHRFNQTYNYSLDASSLCLEPIISHHSPCMPDAGAPIVAEDGLWGITSGWTSEQCPIHPSPTIFTRTSLPLVSAWLHSLL